ncbi:MAG: hypothetical protein WB797_13605 [Nocardioides sp.]
MGTDRKGPLAALVVVAVVAVILLVTAVRSQAAADRHVARHPTTQRRAQPAETGRR